MGIRPSADVDLVLLMLLLLASAASSTAIQNCSIFDEDAQHAKPDHEQIMQYTAKLCSCSVQQQFGRMYGMLSHATAARTRKKTYMTLHVCQSSIMHIHVAKLSPQQSPVIAKIGMNNSMRTTLTHVIVDMLTAKTELCTYTHVHVI